MPVDIYNDEICGKKYDLKHHICFGAIVGGACNVSKNKKNINQNTIRTKKDDMLRK